MEQEYIDNYASSLSRNSDEYEEMDEYEVMDGTRANMHFNSVENSAYNVTTSSTLKSTQIQQNPAYIVAVMPQDTQIPNQDPLLPVCDIVYDEIPTSNGVNNHASQPARTIWNFWQGKVEIAMRIAILTIGSLLFLLLIVATPNAQVIFVTYSSESRLTQPRSATIATGIVWAVLVPSTGIAEVFLLIARVFIKKSKRCIIIWDIIHSFILCVIYLACFSEMAWLSALWIQVNTTTRSSIMAELALLVICSVLSFIQANVYIVKGFWLVAFVKKKWSKN